MPVPVAGCRCCLRVRRGAPPRPPAGGRRQNPPACGVDALRVGGGGGGGGEQGRGHKKGVHRAKGAPRRRGGSGRAKYYKQLRVCIFTNILQICHFPALTSDFELWDIVFLYCVHKLFATAKYGGN